MANRWRGGDRRRDRRVVSCGAPVIGLVAAATLLTGAYSSGGGEDAGGSGWMCTAALDASGEGGSGDSPEAALDAWFDRGASDAFWSAAEWYESARPSGVAVELEVPAPSRSDVVQVRDQAWGWTYTDGRRVEVLVTEGSDGWQAGPSFTGCTSDQP